MDDKQFSGELSTVKAFIEDYLLTRCRIKGKLRLSVKEFERFFRNSPYGRDAFERHQLELDTYVKQCSLYGMEYVIDTYKYHIDFQEVEINDECARVTFTTNEIRKYRCTSEVTMYAPYLAPAIPNFTLTPEESKELSTLQTDLQNLVNEKKAQWTTGQANIDAEWDTYVKQLNQMGLDRYMELYNSAYQRYLSN